MGSGSGKPLRWSKSKKCNITEIAASYMFLLIAAERSMVHIAGVYISLAFDWHLSAVSLSLAEGTEWLPPFVPDVRYSG